MKPTIAGTVLAAILLPGTGCAVEDGSVAEPSGETQQAVSSLGFWDWGCSSTCGLPLGTATDKQQTCFLAGVWGNLQPAASYSEVFVEQTGGHWELQIVTNGRPLGGTAVCVPGAPSKVAQWHSGAAEVSLGSAPNRRCFLSGVRNTSGFTAATDFVQVHQLRTGAWFLGGNMTSEKDALATAVCVDGPSDGLDYGLVSGDGGGFYNVPIQANNPGGWACGLKKLGGHFTSSDYGDGVWIDYNNGISEWELNVVNGKQATTDCLN